MARVLYSDGNAASAMLFQPMVEELSSFLGKANEYVYERVTDIGRSFIDTAASFRDRLGFTRIAQERAAIRDAIADITERANYRVLYEPESFVTCPVPMRTWLYVNPTAHEYATEGKLHGWGDPPIVHEEAIRQEMENHIRDGMMDMETGEINYYYSPFQDMLAEQYELTVKERFRILSAWSRFEDLVLDECIDPTDPYLSTI